MPGSSDEPEKSGNTVLSHFTFDECLYSPFNPDPAKAFYLVEVLSLVLKKRCSSIRTGKACRLFI